MTPIPSHLVFPLTVEQLRQHWHWSKRQLDDFLRAHPYYRGARRTRLIFSDHYVSLVEALPCPSKSTPPEAISAGLTRLLIFLPNLGMFWLLRVLGFFETFDLPRPTNRQLFGVTLLFVWMTP